MALAMANWAQVWVSLQQCINFVFALLQWWLRWWLMHVLALLTSTHSLVLCQGYQCLEVGSGGFLSLASGFNTSGILSQWLVQCLQLAALPLI